MSIGDVGLVIVALLAMGIGYHLGAKEERRRWGRREKHFERYLDRVARDLDSTERGSN